MVFLFADFMITFRHLQFLLQLGQLNTYNGFKLTFFIIWLKRKRTFQDYNLLYYLKYYVIQFYVKIFILFS